MTIEVASGLSTKRRKTKANLGAVGKLLKPIIRDVTELQVRLNRLRGAAHRRPLFDVDRAEATEILALAEALTLQLEDCQEAAPLNFRQTGRFDDIRKALDGIARGASDFASNSFEPRVGWLNPWQSDSED
jgi:hypothetical protein